MHSLKTIEDFIELIESLKTKKKPHKHLLLLSLCHLFDSSPTIINEFPYNDKLIEVFSELTNKYFPNENILLEYPYYHLKSSGIWHHKIKDEKNVEYRKYKRFTPKRIKDVIEYSFLDSNLFDLLKNSEIRSRIESSLIQQIDPNNFQQSKIKKNRVNDVMIDSKFPHEKKAIESILNNLSRFAEFIPNYFLFDPSTNQYLECDLIAVSTDRLAIIELKHWSGEISIRSNQWLVRNYYRRDPHIPNKYKCQVLRSYYESKFSTYPNLWVESIVVLTNPEADIDGESHYKYEKHNPTFADIETLVKHYKFRANLPELKKIEPAQVKKIADIFRQQAGDVRPKGFSLPGYETIENLTSSPDKIEILGRPSAHGLQTIQKIRIFLDDPHANDSEKKKFRERSINSLKAIGKIGDHPNINKVWLIPHEEGLIIEASDWSQEGTLADLIQIKKHFNIDNALPIIRGIIEGLIAIHKEMVIHRAICPANIMMVKNTPKLINFDLSYVYEDERPYTMMPETNLLKPSPYIAPELYQEKKDVHEVTDLFSVGVIFFEMLTGHPPFKTSKELEKNDQWQKNAEKALKDANVPETFQILIFSLIEQDYKKRPQSSEELLDEITSLLKEESTEITKTERSNRELEPGELDNVYEIVKFLDKGRSAQVYEVKHISQQKFAIKLFYHEILRDRVIAEHKALQRSASPYVVKCEGFFQWNDGRYFLVFNLIEGDPLREYIKNKFIPDMDTFRHVTHCLFEALIKMHSSSDEEEPLLHCDLKPENIILSNQGNPVLIDFGTSTIPHIGPYMGTLGYVAPDLINGVDLEYCESGDLFALGVTLFEWFYGFRPYDNDPKIDSTPLNTDNIRDNIPESLHQWFSRSVQPLRENRFSNIQEMQKSFEEIFKQKEIIEEIKTEDMDDESENIDSFQPSSEYFSNAQDKNDFVTYLNTLHNVTPANENSLAESQALSKYFGDIHVPLDLTRFIFEQLTSSQGSNVILTGHAGDGKSTIGLELYKKLKNIPMNDPLTNPLKEKEEVSLPDGMTVILIKDMSELGNAKIQELLDTCSNEKDNIRRFIISNTGALLDTFEELAKEKDINPLELESLVLEKLEKHDPEFLEILDTKFSIINLAQMDNVGTAATLFDKILNEKHWQSCMECRYKELCPIALNIITLKNTSNITKDRITGIYRRVFEYGKRLTMRQIAAHLAYSITSGLDCSDIAKYATQAPKAEITDFLFYNRFFGFKSTSAEDESLRLAAVESLMPLEMGAKPYPPLERKLWMKESGILPQLPDSLEKIFISLCKAVKNGADNVPLSRIRQQIRRLLYMFGDFQSEDQAFIPVFQDSLMLAEFVSWQSNNLDINNLKMDKLKRKVLHVLQEQYTGIHMPESTNPHDLFITLKRGNTELRQSVQILLAKIPLSAFSLKLRPINSKVEPIRYMLSLIMESQPEICLDLELPFLDFVMLRDTGEIGQKLDVSYLDRLERFKANLLDVSDYRNNKDLELLEMTDDGNFRIPKIHFNGEMLQVAL